MCLNETYSRVRIGKNLADKITVQNGLKRDALSPLLFNFALEYMPSAGSKRNRKDKLNGKYQLLAYADDVNTRIVGENINTIQKLSTEFGVPCPDTCKYCIYYICN
jgi:hypothetical protein